MVAWEASALASGSAQALTIADENTAPAGVTLSSPTTAGAGVALGNIGAGQVEAFWIRRTAANAAALSNDGVTIAFTGDTGSCDAPDARAGQSPGLWKGMNPNTRGTPLRGRGVKVCPRWDGFRAFLGDMGPRPAGHSLDRVDNDGPCSPENCRWVTDSVQRRNRRDNVLLTLHGRTMVMEDWAKELGVPQRMLCARLERGWSVTDALTRPVRRSSRTVSTGSL